MRLATKAFFGLLGLAINPADAVGIAVKPHGRECIVIEGTPASHVLVHYDYSPTAIRVDCNVMKIQQQHRPVPNTRVAPPKAVTVLTDSYAQQPTLNLTSFIDDSPTHDPTKFEICWTHMGSDPAVDLRFVVQADAQSHKYDLATSQHAQSLHLAVKEARDAIEKLMARQEFQIGELYRQRDTMKSAHRKIYHWTLIRIMGLATLGGVQVLYIRRLFSGTKTIL